MYRAPTSGRQQIDARVYKVFFSWKQQTRDKRWRTHRLSGPCSSWKAYLRPQPHLRECRPRLGRSGRDGDWFSRWPLFAWVASDNYIPTSGTLSPLAEAISPPATYPKKETWPGREPSDTTAESRPARQIIGLVRLQVKSRKPVPM